MNHSDQQNHLRIIALPHVLSTERGRIDAMRPAGGTVPDLLRSIGWIPEQLHARVFIDGQYVKEAAWEYTVPRAGQSVVVRAIPMGGDDGGKNLGRMVAMISIMVLAIALQQYWVVPLAGALSVSTATAFAIGLGAVSILSSLGISALIPPPLPRRALPQPADESELKEVA